jgi:hypothetical protein
MLELNELSTQELSMLRRQVREEFFLRFFHIARASDPSDQALQDLLMKMAKEAHVQAQSTPGGEEWPPFASARSLSVDQIREFIRTALPSLSKGFGEGVLHRDIALFYAVSSGRQTKHRNTENMGRAASPLLFGKMFLNPPEEPACMFNQALDLTRLGRIPRVLNRKLFGDQPGEVFAGLFQTIDS